MQLGRARTMFCSGRGVLLDPREPPDTGEGSVWQLQHLPLGIFVQPANRTELVLITPKTTGVAHLDLPQPVEVRGKTLNHINVRRRGIPLREGYVVTDFFIQGMSFKHDCWLLHINPPPTGPLLGSSVLVCVSRYPTAAELHLLAPLFHDEASKEKVVQAFQRALTKSKDIIADTQRLRRLHDARVQRQAAAAAAATAAGASSMDATAVPEHTKPVVQDIDITEERQAEVWE